MKGTRKNGDRSLQKRTPVPPGPEVKVGQVWKDRDRRNSARRILITGVEPKQDGAHAYALVKVIDPDGVGLGRRTYRIRLDRFRPSSTGYDLTEETYTRPMTEQGTHSQP